jgi:chemotaxis protein methyltransferase CheR
MNDQDYKFLEDLLRRESGLCITPEKIYLLESRLRPLIRKHKIPDGLDGLAQKLRLAHDVELKRAVIDAMTTNETSFFRDTTPFQRLKEDILPHFIKLRTQQKTIRIWSAGCSTGQEPYSIAMLLKENQQIAGWHCEIVATDLSQNILTRAKAGIYSQFEIQRGLPVQLMIKYFDRQGDNWEIKQSLKDAVTFKMVNLLESADHLGQFDIIFCRNVLIYFDMPTKVRVLTSIKSSLRQDGALFLGSAETVINISGTFKPLSKIVGVYVRSDSTFIG